MKIAILGAGGRLGAALSRAWAATDEVLAFTRADIDLAQPGEIDRVLDPLRFDVLVNCAALTNVDYCETHEDEAMRINAGAVREIGALCARKHARCLHISTDYVFDGDTDRPYTEADEARAISVYGESKLRGEVALLDTSAEHLAVRVSWVFGPDRPSFIDGILKRALESDTAEAIGDKWSTPSYPSTSPDAAPLPARHPMRRHPARQQYRRMHLAGVRPIRPRMRRPRRPPGENDAGAAHPHGRRKGIHRPPPCLYRALDWEAGRPRRSAPRPWQAAVDEYIAGYAARARR